MRVLGSAGRSSRLAICGVHHTLNKEDIVARFPESEPEIAVLAALVVEGLELAVEDFPAPPVPATELKAKLDRYTEARAATVAAETETREQHAIKDEALDDLVDGMKADLKYAEIAVRDRPEKLSKLGWAGPRSSSRLGAPGEVRNIGIVAEGDTWAILRWKPPVEGGRAGFYKIQRQSEDAVRSWFRSTPDLPDLEPEPTPPAMIVFRCGGPGNHIGPCFQILRHRNHHLSRVVRCLRIAEFHRRSLRTPHRRGTPSEVQVRVECQHQLRRRLGQNRVGRRKATDQLDVFWRERGERQ